jgi:uncharacterized protein DUF6065
VKLTAYLPQGHQIDIRPAPLERPWMEATNERFAYRCLPLNIANAHGWEILCPQSLTAVWMGGTDTAAIIINDEGGRPGAMAMSHFGHGILTFHVPCLFQTEPGFDLMAQGPINLPKDGVSALSGIIETDWSPYSFTMNWQMTRPGLPVHFSKGEPFCHIFPVRRADLEETEPVMDVLSAKPELQAEHAKWMANRNEFLVDLEKPGSDAQNEKWQRTYYRGMMPSGAGPVEQHRTRLRLKPFAKA